MLWRRNFTFKYRLSDSTWSSSVVLKNFNKYYTTIHRYESNRLRNIAQFFGTSLRHRLDFLDVVWLRQDQRRVVPVFSFVGSWYMKSWSDRRYGIDESCEEIQWSCSEEGVWRHVPDGRAEEYEVHHWLLHYLKVRSSTTFLLRYWPQFQPRLMMEQRLGHTRSRLLNPIRTRRVVGDMSVVVVVEEAHLDTLLSVDLLSVGFWFHVFNLTWAWM